MKKFSRMPKSESGGLGGGSSSGGGTGVTNYIGKVFAVGRYQVTVDELIAEGMLHFVSLSPLNLKKKTGMFVGNTMFIVLFTL